MKKPDVWIGTKVHRSDAELVVIIRDALRRKYAGVKIRIEGEGEKWTAVAEVASQVTRERIEKVVRRLRLHNARRIKAGR
jgi:hypothetical protein